MNGISGWIRELAEASRLSEPRDHFVDRTESTEVMVIVKRSGSVIDPGIGSQYVIKSRCMSLRDPLKLLLGGSKFLMT